MSLDAEWATPAPELAASAPLRLLDCCPYATAIVRRRAAIRDADDDRTLGVWRLRSGQQVSMVNRRGRSVLLIDAGSWIIEVDVPDLGQDVAEAKRATTLLGVVRITDRGPVLDSQAIGVRNPQEITVDFGTGQPFLSLLKQPCSGTAVTPDRSSDRPMLSRCFKRSGIRAIAQGDSYADVRRMLNSLTIANA